MRSMVEGHCATARPLHRLRRSPSPSKLGEEWRQIANLSVTRMSRPASGA